MGMLCRQGDGEMAEHNPPAIIAGRNYLKQQKFVFLLVYRQKKKRYICMFISGCYECSWP